MHEDLNTHYREALNSATNLLSAIFQKQIHFSKVTQLSEPDRRNVILRLQIDNPTAGMPQTLILKKNSIEKQIFDKSESETEIEQTTRFARDWAGIEFLTQVGGDHAPRFYAGSMEHRFIIIEDLGLEHPSLVGPLTREFSNTNLQQAKIALIAYVRRLGKMHAAPMGKYDQFNAIIKRVYPQAIRSSYIPEIDCVKNILKQLINNNSKELIQEVQSVLEFPQSPNKFQVLLHGDICPDNVYYASGNMRFIDF